MHNLLVTLLVILGVAIVAVPAFYLGVKFGEDKRDWLLSQIIMSDPDNLIQFIQQVKSRPYPSQVSIKLSKKEKE